MADLSARLHDLISYAVEVGRELGRREAAFLQAVQVTQEPEATASPRPPPSRSVSPPARAHGELQTAVLAALRARPRTRNELMDEFGASAGPCMTRLKATGQVVKDGKEWRCVVDDEGGTSASPFSMPTV